MSDGRPPIPMPVKRKVRQGCGFGCVVCGLPLYEYDHLVPYSEVKAHDPQNLVLLCDRHHREKTAGLLSRSQVAAAHALPYNVQMEESYPYGLHYEGASCEALVGSNKIVWPELVDGSVVAGILIDDTPIIGFAVDEGRLLLTVQLLNDANELLLQIVESELTFSMSSWDVEFAGNRLTIRHAPEDIFVKLAFEPPYRVVIDRGRFWRNGVELKVTPQELLIAGGIQMAGVEISNCPVGMLIGEDKLGVGAGFFMPAPARQSFQYSEETEGRIIRAVAV